MIQTAFAAGIMHNYYHVQIFLGVGSTGLYSRLLPAYQTALCIFCFNPRGPNARLEPCGATALRTVESWTAFSIFTAQALIKAKSGADSITRHDCRFRRISRCVHPNDAVHGEWICYVQMPYILCLRLGRAQDLAYDRFIISG